MHPLSHPFLPAPLCVDVTLIPESSNQVKITPNSRGKFRTEYLQNRHISEGTLVLHEQQIIDYKAESYYRCYVGLKVE